MISFKQYLIEATTKTLIMVDIQPTYKESIHFVDHNLFRYCSQFPRIEVFYNGEDFGFESEQEVRDFYYENGCTERTQNKMKFFEKNYAFFRDLMDDGVDDEDIVKIGKLLLSTNRYDWRDLLEDEFEELGIDLDPHTYAFNIPDVLFEIKRLPNNCVLIGGGRDECLKEVELCFQILDKPYEVNWKYVY
jgi:hypothetical protein